ncbi:MAG: hypothetical protein ACHQ1H_01360, partial [Nitrososphaerales archaeon]
MSLRNINKLGKIFGYSLVIALIAFLFITPSAFAVRNSISFSPSLNLSNDGNNARYPMIANSGNNVYVAWTEQSHGIYYRYSADGGIIWTPGLTQSATRLSSRGGTASYPVIAANGTNVYVAWTLKKNNVTQIYIRA